MSIISEYSVPIDVPKFRYYKSLYKEALKEIQNRLIPIEKNQRLSFRWWIEFFKILVKYNLITAANMEIYCINFVYHQMRLEMFTKLCDEAYDILEVSDIHRNLFFHLAHDLKPYAKSYTRRNSL